MQIFVKTITGRAVPLQANPSDVISDVKQRIEDEQGIPLQRQRLFCANNELKDCRALSEYNLEEDTTLDLRLRKRDEVNGCRDACMQLCWDA